MGGNLSEEQRNILNLIDAILSMIEKMPKDEYNFTIIANPFDFLLSIIEKRVSFDEMIEWLSKMITYILPSIELAVKGILIAKLKERIDCNSDPRIPNWLRKEVKNSAINDILPPNVKRGMLFSLQDIDYKNMMGISPLTPYGSNFYHGISTYYIIDDERLIDNKYSNKDDAIADCRNYGIRLDKIKNKSNISSIHELARAKDFNAFLWYLMHKGYYTYVGIQNGEEGINLLESCEFTPNENESSKFHVGDILCQEGEGNDLTKSIILSSNSIINGSVNNSDKNATNSDISQEVIQYNYIPRDYSYNIVPISTDNKSLNWYANSGTYFDFLIPEEEREPRDYNKEFAICNLEYLEKEEWMNNYGGVRYLYDGLNFTILPKPFVHVPRKGEPAWRFKKILFNSKGQADKKGKYSVRITDLTPNDPKDGDFYIYNTNLNDIKLKINKKSGEYFLDDGKSNEEIDIKKLYKILYECYPGLTVYEFNYDFVMSMQLFDPVTVASQLISLITDIRYGGVASNLNITKTETAYQMRISEIVKNIVESTAYEVSDCFYTFDNDKFDSMIRESELKRSNLYPFNKNGKNELTSNSDADKSFEILNSFDDKANLNENTEIIKRAIVQATASITQEVLPQDVYKIKFNIITDIIKSLVNILVESLLTPKIILLFEVNMELLGERDRNNFSKSIDDFLQSIGDLLIAIVKEIRDLILKELLNWVLKILEELMNILKDALVREQLEYYSRLMKLLLKACSFKAKHRSPLESKLDNVDYADIDEIDRPLESKC